jgi:hypothetical protein
MRHSREKNKNNFNPKWPFLFNAVIDSFEGEREQLENARDDLTKLLREEELRFYQQAKVNDVLLGIIIPSISRWWQLANIGKMNIFPGP